jgi:hypothetical protein
LGKIKDFSSYVAKIQAANADTVITGNWGKRHCTADPGRGGLRP